MASKGIRLPLPSEESWSDCLEIGETADDLGIDTIWVPEMWGRNSVILSTQLAERIDTADLCSGIFNIYGRSPGLMAMTASGLAAVTDGQYRLGIGTSGPAVVENVHGQPFEAPLPRTREYIEIIEAFLAGETVDYEGRVFDMSGFALDPPAEHNVPIYLGAMGEHNLRLVGQFADGWLPLFVPRSGYEQAFEHIEIGADRRDYSVDNIDIAPYILTCISESDPEAARDLVRGAMAFYVGAMGDFYYNAVRRFGFEDVADAIRERWQNGDYDAARSSITDKAIDDFAIAGTPEKAANQLAKFRDAGVDSPIAYIPPKASTKRIKQTIEIFASL